MFNKVILVGRLGADPEIKYSASGVPVARMRIATDESYTDRDGTRVKRTEWHTAVVFQNQAEHCKNYLTKGSLVCVEGSLQTRKWQDQQGQDRYTTEVKALRVRFLDRKGEGGADHGQEAGSQDFPGSEMDESPFDANRGQGRNPSRSQGRGAENLGSPFPSGASDSFPASASGIDDVPF